MKLVDMLKTMGRRKLLLLSVLSSVVLTLIIVSVLSIAFHGRITHDYLITGSIAALIVSLIIVSVIEQILEQLRASERELVEAAGRLRSLLETSTGTNVLLQTLIQTIPDMVFLRDARGRYLVVNKTTEEYIGIGQEYLLGKTNEEILPPDTAEMCNRSDEEAVRRGNPTHVEEHFFAKDGRTIYFDMLKVPVYDGKGGLTGLLCIARDITERKKAETQIRQSLHEKMVLLKEIHHRVKNNLQVISSLLMLQARHIKDGTIRTILDESRNRIHSIALVHEKLYGTQDLNHIDFAGYVGSLIKDITRVYNRPDLAFFVNMPGIFLDINMGIPCGLIINELVSNCLKHAFPENRQGTIRIGLEKAPAGMYVLTVADDGTGFPPDLDFRNTASLGLQLINTLTAQLNGTLELFTGQGTTFRMTFPESTKMEVEENGEE